MNGKRILAGLIDFLIAAFIQFILFMIFIIVPIIKGHNIDTLILDVLLITLTSMCYLIFRDVLGPKSIGKVIFKLEIIDNCSNQPVPAVRRILRNITWLLSFLEIIFFFANRGNRLGDILARTKVQ